MTTEFISIKEAVENHKGSFKGSCIKASDLKAGSGAKGDWTMKKFTLQDPSGEVEIGCFNEEINYFKVGGFYEIDNPWFKEYQDRENNTKFSCNLGQYCKVKLVDNPPTQTTIPKDSSEEIEPEPKGRGSVNGEEIPGIKNPETLEFVDSQTLILLQFREAVKVRMLKYSPRISEVNGAELGGYTLEIYRQYRIHKEKLEV